MIKGVRAVFASEERVVRFLEGIRRKANKRVTGTRIQVPVQF